MQPAQAFDQLVQITLTTGLPAAGHFLLWFGLEAASVVVSTVVGVVFLMPFYLVIYGVWIFLKAIARACNEQPL